MNQWTDYPVDATQYKAAARRMVQLVELEHERILCVRVSVPVLDAVERMFPVIKPEPGKPFTGRFLYGVMVALTTMQNVPTFVIDFKDR